jgi:hypothetical protein
MKTTFGKSAERQLRVAGPGLIALLGSEDERVFALGKRRWNRSRRQADDLFTKSAGPRHD